jgi:phosphatidylethanolamine/phosphatidyl-N-methylethanolamine N-methyltransferase
VLSSMWALGVTGTYLGDYFGILMDTRVTGFPFNVCPWPMYLGSWLCFVAVAIYRGRPAGLALCVEVAVGYVLALRWEDPFTGMIYERRERERKAAGRKAE